MTKAKVRSITSVLSDADTVLAGGGPAGFCLQFQKGEHYLDTVRLTRDAAVNAAMQTIMIASVFGGLTAEERAWLAQLGAGRNMLDIATERTSAAVA
jgi:hypothetical protein